MSVYFRLAILIFCLGFSVNGNAGVPEQNYRFLYNEQDRPNPMVDNPMKGLSKFIVFAMSPARTKKSSEKVLQIVERELKKYGQVNTPKMLIQTEKGEEINLTSFGNSVTLIYQIKNVTDLKGKELGVVRASLNLAANVSIDKTKEECSPYIWVSNCFLKGSTSDRLEQLVEQSLRSLLVQFSVSFSAVNSDKPVFDLQGTN